MKSVQEVVQEQFEALLRRTNVNLPSPLPAETILLESGVDSLGFATLVTLLEDELGYDPFLLMDEPVYPQTYGEFVAIYERFADHRIDDN